MRNPVRYKDYPIGFCADPLWDNFHPLYNDTSGVLPTFTECFEHTVLVGIPLVFFWLLFPALIFQTRTSRAFLRPLPWTTLMSMKWLVSMFLLGDKVFLLVVTVWQAILGAAVPTADIVGPGLQIITLIALLAMKNECRRFGIRSSGILFLTWLLFVICGFPEFYTWLRIGGDSELVANTDFLRYLAYLVWYPLLLIELALCCFADPMTIFADEIVDDIKNCPEVQASFVNSQTLYWFGEIISRGNKKTLELDDLFEIPPEMTADDLMGRWTPQWVKRKKAYEKELAVWEGSDESRRARASSQRPLLEAADKPKKYGAMTAVEVKGKKRLGPPLPSVLGILWSLFRWDLLGVSLVKFCSDLLQFANPLFLNLLILFTEDANAPWSNGLLYALGLFACNMLRSFMLNHYFVRMNSIGQQIASVMSSAIYQKTLRLSAVARKQKTVGEIVNLMAIDVDRFRNITPQLQQFWSSPFQIILTLVLLYNLIGWSVIAGVVIMTLLIPLNLFSSRIVKRWQSEQMRAKDERTKLTNEVLNGIKVVKLYAWEPAMEKTIDDIRRHEVHLIRKSQVINTFLAVGNISAPFFVALCTFATYTLSDSSHVLDPQIAFVSLTLFNQLRAPLMMIADLVAQTIQTIVSNERLKEFLVADELNEEEIDRDFNINSYEKAVEAECASFVWDAERHPQIDCVSIGVQTGHLLAVVGRVGAAKSSLLSAILGEMKKLQGYVGVRGMVAYVPQQPWIQNLTLRDNILMEKPFDQKLYDEVIEACALRPDLQLLPDGDQTEIGEKGINLSGGQKARVALARAVYQQRDVYLLDDPLSAVDAHVARHIFDKVIGPQGMLRHRTRLLVTHGLTFLKETDAVVIMKDGRITHIDKFEVLVEDEEVNEMLKEVEVEKKEDEGATSSASEENADAGDEDDEGESILSGRSKISTAFRRSVSVQSKKSLARKQSSRLMMRDAEKATLIEKEISATGRVKLAIYGHYFKAMGVCKYFLPYVLLMCCSTGFQIGRAFWLTDWSNDNIPGADPANAKPLGLRLGIYAGIGISENILVLVGFTLFICGAVQASLNLHKPLLHNILRSPLSFFDVTPLGRILNRLGKDIEVIDLRLSSNIRFVLLGILNITQTMIVISTTTPIFIAFAVVLLFIYVLVLRYYISSARQLQRMSSVYRSPIYSHFGETIQGLSTIRAFGWTERFFADNKKKVDTYIRCNYFYLIANRWLGIRLELLGNSVILVTALLAVWSKATNSTTAGLIGLTVSYSLNISFMLNMVMRQIGELETSIVSVERVREYSEGHNEGQWRLPKKTSSKWPEKGEVTFKEYTTRYRPGLDLVLKGLNMKISAGEKVGVVGRTGAGKSSLALALFRIVEPASGRISIDDVDITAIGLHDLREKLSIIPQDPVLFSGTIRFNIDPTGNHSDEDIWKALDHAHLADFVKQQPHHLEHVVDEGGENISVGQRQLVCLARAILRRSQVLVLDEATAAVDTITDSLIQKTIREVFAKSTVITIAHRLNTIVDYDKIIVMDDGRISEMDSPANLLANPNSIFHAMAKSAKII